MIEGRLSDEHSVARSVNIETIKSSSYRSSKLGFAIRKGGKSNIADRVVCSYLGIKSDQVSDFLRSHVISGTDRP